MHDNDLWEQFVQENWAPYLENAFGPDWRSSYPEDVTAILRWASSQAKDHEKEYPISEPRTMEAAQQGSGAPCGNSLTFGSFQPDSVEEEMPNGETKYSVSQERTKRASATEQLRGRGLSREERLPPPGLRLSDDADEMMVDEELYHPSWNRNLPDLNPLLEKLDLDGFPGFDWENLHMVMRGQMPNKHPPQSGSRQERLKVKRTGGTKRQGEDRNVLSSAANDKPHVQTIEQRIEITGSSATFEARTRSIPSKQVSGITNQPTFRIPIEYSSSTGPSPAGLFQGYSFAATGNENGTSFKAFGSGTTATQSTSNSYPYPANTSSIFSLFGSGISTSLEGTPPREWVMEETGMAVDVDDPHHPHKRVHKHFTAEASGKVNKAVKTKGRRHGSRQTTPVFSSRVPSNQLHGMTSPVAPFSARAKLDDGMETKRDAGILEKATDGLGESKFKREDEGGHSPKQGRSSSSVKNDRMREASQKTSLFMMTRAQVMDSASKGSLSASRSSSGRQGIGTGDPLGQPPLPSSEASLCPTETRVGCWVTLSARKRAIVCLAYY